MQLELYPGTSDELVLLAYSSAQNLTAGAGFGVAMGVAIVDHWDDITGWFE